MRDFLVALVGAVVSLAYWSLVSMAGFALGAADVAPGAPPPAAGAMQFRVIAVLVVAVIVYALLTLAWNRLLGRRRAPGSPAA